MAVEYLGSGQDDGVNHGRSATDKIGFYGLATPIAQQSASALTTLSVTSGTAGGFGFTTSAQFEAMIAQQKAIVSGLKSLGIWTTV
jgi:hypothetical protein